MATSEAYAFNPDTLDIVEDAYEMVGIEGRGGYDLRTARRSLNLLKLEWANRGLNLWTIKEFLVDVDAASNTVTLPIEAIDLIECFWRTGDGEDQHDSPLTRMSVSTYANMTNKNQPGNPSQFYVHRKLPQHVVRLWPTPTEAGILGGYGLRLIQDVGAYTNTIDVPTRFLPALICGLAYYLSMKIPSAVQRTPMLQQEYERQFMLAAEEDRDRASFRAVPDLRSYNR
jgi:hypothetical protein